MAAHSWSLPRSQADPTRSGRILKGFESHEATTLIKQIVIVCAAVVGLGLLPAVGGVPPSVVALYAAYFLVFILAPGVVVAAVCGASQRGLAHLIAIGLAVGYTLELLAFWITAVANQRGLFIAYPAMVLGPALIYRLAGPSRRRGWRPSLGRVHWSAIAVAAAVIVAIVASAYAETPLPGHARHAYFADVAYHISLAADAKNHWPIVMPWIVGEPLHYHWFLYGHLAAASQVTGIQIPILLLRIDLPVLLLVTCLEIVVLSSLLSRRRFVGALSLLFCLILEGLSLDPKLLAPFNNYLFEDFYRSPTFLYGIPLFLAALIVGVGLLEARTASNRAGPWALFALLLVGCTGAKVTILPILVGGTILLLAWELLSRRAPRAVWGLLGACTVGLVGSYFAIYSGGGLGLHLAPLEFVSSTLPAQALDAAFPNAVGLPLRVVEFLLWGSAMFVTLIGIPLAVSAGWPLSLGAKWVLWIFTASLGCTLSVNELGQSGIYFLQYGLISVGVLSASALVEWWSRQIPRWHAARYALLLGCAGATALGLLLLQAPTQRLLRLPLLTAEAMPYLLLALALGLLHGVSRGRRFSSSGTRFAVLLLLVPASFNTVFTMTTTIRGRLVNQGPPGYSADAGLRLVTPQLLDGLVWLRDNTSTNTLVAVNNHFRDRGHADARMFVYSAFSERRFLVETWAWTPESLSLQARTGIDSPNPFPSLSAVNDSAFASADAQSLGLLRTKYNIRYLFIDKLAGDVAPALYTRPTFSNSEVAVVDLSR